jgi:hypothetical protein
MTDVTTGGAIVVTTSVMTDEITGVMVNVARTITTATTIIARSDLYHHHHLKGQP